MSRLRIKIAMITAFVALFSTAIWGINLFPAPFSAHAAAQNYYVAPATSGGNDNNDGTSTGSPFEHIQKCASTVQAGGTCYVRGGTYHETVTPSNSGSSGNPITFQPYNGESVIIDGADTVTGWSQQNGNIYQANVNLNTSLFANQIFVDGQMLNEARWPNTGLDLLHQTRATAASGTTNSTIYDSNIPNIDWNGATVHIWGAQAWTSQTGTVTSSSAGQVTFNGANDTCPYLCADQGSLYYLSGVPAALDAPGEWFYDAKTHQLSIWTLNGDNPSAHSVEAKQRTNAFDLSDRSYITLNGFNIFAATITTSASSSNDLINGINTTYVSHFSTIPVPTNLTYPSNCPGASAVVASHMLDTGIILNGTYNTLSNSTISESAGNGVSLQGNHNTVTNNLIHDTDYMGAWGALVYIQGQNQTVSHNTLYNTGRDAITALRQYNGCSLKNDSISYNDVYNFGLLNQDLGGIYIGGNVDGTGTSIDHNWFHDNQVKSGREGWVGAGIYVDDSSANFLIHHNVVWNNVGSGIFAHGGSVSAHNELIYNNTDLGGDAGIVIGCDGSDVSGSRVMNNIAKGGLCADSNATVANNLPTSTDPLLINPASSNFYPTPVSPAIDAGQPISGITDGYAGSAPDEGAYEYLGGHWVPGCGHASGDLALNQSATASSSDGSLTPINAIDGNNTTRWSSTYSGQTEFYQVDLGASYNVNEVKITWEAAFATNYTLSTSNNNSDFTTVSTVTGRTGGFTDDTFNATSARYLRIMMTGHPSTLPFSGYSFYTFQVYANGTGGGSTFSTGLEHGQPQPTWTNTVDTHGGGISNVGGICCGLNAPEAGLRNELTHTGNSALMYSGSATNSGGPDYSYMEVFDLSGPNIMVGSNTTLTYWINPGSSSTNSLVRGNNSTCVAIDLIFSDGSTLRDSGAVDQHGNRAHPASQCNQLTIDTWNLVTIKLGAHSNGLRVMRVNLGYDQPDSTGGYRGYIDDISIQ